MQASDRDSGQEDDQDDSGNFEDQDSFTAAVIDMGIDLGTIAQVVAIPQGAGSGGQAMLMICRTRLYLHELYPLGCGCVARALGDTRPMSRLRQEDIQTGEWLGDGEEMPKPEGAGGMNDRIPKNTR